MLSVRPIDYLEAKKMASIQNLGEVHRIAKVRPAALLDVYNKLVDTILMPEVTISEWRKAYSNERELKKLLGKLYVFTAYVEYLLNGNVKNKMFTDEEQRAVAEFVEAIRELPVGSDAIKTRIEAGDVGRFYDAVKTFYKVLDISRKSEFKAFLETGVVAYWEESGKEAISEAIKLIIEGNPILFIRLMSDYEKLIIESQELSRKAESELKEEKYAELLDRVEAMHAEFSKRLEEAQSEALSYRERANLLESKLKELEAERNRLIQELAKRERELENMRNTIKEQIGKLKEAEERASEDKMIIASLRAQISDLSEKLSKYEEAIRTLREERERLISENESLKSVLAETRERIEGRKEGRPVPRGRAEVLAHMFKEAVKGLIGIKVGDVTISRKSQESTNSVVLEGKKGVWKKHKAYIKAFVVMDNSDLKRYGYYLTAVSELTVKSIVEREKAGENEKTILIIASPTGFTKDAIEFAKRDTTINTILVLYDLESGEMFYNGLRENELPPTFLERIRIKSMDDLYRKFEDIVKERMKKGLTLPPYDTYVIVEDFAKDAKISLEDALKFFRSLEESGKGELLELDDVLVFGVRI